MLTINQVNIHCRCFRHFGPIHIFNVPRRTLAITKSAKKPLSFSNLLMNRTLGTVISEVFVKRNGSFSEFWKKTLQRKDFGSYDVVQPGTVSPQKTVPEHIACPPYSVSGLPPEPPELSEIKNENEIEKMWKACQLARKILDTVGNKIEIGMRTDDIDEIVHQMAIENNAYPSPLNYLSFPKSVCTSVNNVACHGIPDDRPLQGGDIINVDVTVFLDGYHGDCSETFLIGSVDRAGTELINTCRKALEQAISICRPGEKFSNIGAVIEEVTRQKNLTVVPAFTGHGIGTYFHGPPDIYHCYNRYPGIMQPGMTFTIEPVLAQGTDEIVILEDGWTAVMLDNARAAQCEHTILITERGCRVLTKSD